MVRKEHPERFVIIVQEKTPSYIDGERFCRSCNLTFTPVPSNIELIRCPICGKPLRYKPRFKEGRESNGSNDDNNLG